MTKSKDLTDKEILAIGKKNPRVKRRTLFKEYAVAYCNLGMANRDSKTMRKELPAIAKRGAEMVMKHILNQTRMPGKLKDYEKPFITIMIYSGIMKEIGDKKEFIYPSASDGYGLEEA